MCTDKPLPSEPLVETEQEKDIQQLNQASDTTALLQDELTRATDRERQLQTQVDKMKDDVSQLQTQLEQLFNLQKEFDEYKRHSELLLEEQEMKHRDSTFDLFHLRNAGRYAGGILCMYIVQWCSHRVFRWFNEPEVVDLKLLLFTICNVVKSLSTQPFLLSNQNVL